MNTTTKEPALGTEVRTLALELCHPNPWNKERPLDEAFLQSLREKGQIVIALVRPHPSKQGEYEVIFGDRRRRGLLAIHSFDLLAEVREMDDEEAELLCAIENKQRAGLSWWQEAELIEEYLQKHGDGRTNAIAAALGMKNQQVLRRKQLLTLTKKWRDAIKKGEPEGWGPECFELIALYPAKTQDDFFQQLDRGWCPDDVPGLKRWLADKSKVLKHAPWDLKDATLCPKAGSCAACPSRSGANPNLFADDSDDDETIGAEDTCLEPKCWDEKAEAHIRRRLDEARQKAKEAGQEPPLQISSESYSGDEKKKILGYHAFEVCKKTDPGARLAVYMDGDKKGTEVYVQIGKDRGKKKGDKPAKAEATPGKAMTPLKDRIAAKNKQRDALAITKLIAYIEKEADKEAFEKEAQPLLTQYALVYGLEADLGRSRSAASDKAIATRVRAFAKQPITAVELWGACSDHMTSELRSLASFGLHAGEPAAKHEIVRLIAWIVGADFEALRAEAEAELPDPASWAKEREEEKTTKPAKKAKRAAAGPDELEDDLAGDDEAGL